VRVPNQFILKPKELPDETTVFVPAVR
jgi:hypothetical protein